MQKRIIVQDINEDEKLLHYQVWYETHPKYKDMPVSQLKKMFDFSRDESVPDITIIRIETDLENFHRDVVEHEIMFNEGITNREEIVFEN